jgi:hypothetical protein
MYSDLGKQPLIRFIITMLELSFASKWLRWAFHVSVSSLTTPKNFVD